MPEGDTLFRTAVMLRKALLGKQITGLDTDVEQVRAVNTATPVTGRTVTDVEACGKHLLITFSPPEEATTSPKPLRSPGQAPPHHLTTSSLNSQPSTKDLILHTHLRMTGSWHIYRPGEAWRKPARYAKVVLHTEEFVVPCFSAPVVELLTRWQAERHPDLVALGPDAMTEEFDAEEALRRMQRRPEVEIGVALLNQRLMAGVGNVYKSEVLFIRRVSPFLKVGELSEEMLRGLIEESHRLLRLNQGGGQRRTMFGLRESDRLWAYGRSGEPCRVCGETIRMRRQGMDARSTYYCPCCQNVG